MKRLLLKIKNFYGSMDNLEQKMFWVILPVVIGCAIVSFTATVIENIGVIPIAGTSISVVIPFIIGYVAKKSGKYDFCYFLLCILVSGILVPYAFCISGGLISGMPIFCAGSAVLCGFCFKKKYRYISTAFSMFVTLEVFHLAAVRPGFVIEMPEDLIVQDITLSYLIISLSLSVVSSVVINEFHHNTITSSILGQHMDRKISSMLLGKNNESLHQGVRSKSVVLFADINNFTSITETMEPEVVADFLNLFFEIADECIHNHGGILDKFIGDCVMAFWKDDGESEPATQACLTVLDMKDRIDSMCEEIYSRFKCELEFSCGINYGDAVIGDVGSDKRKDFTVIGDAVNMASRLQDAAPMGGMYVSSSVADRVNDLISLTRVPKKVVLKGKSDPVDIYTISGLRTFEVPEPVLPEKKVTGYVLHICGSRGSYSLSGKRYMEFGGETSCYLLIKDDYALIIDCGTGLQRAREIIKDCKRIDVIITHLHYDHIIGMLDWSIFPKGAELTFYGGFDKWLGDASLSRLFEAPYWPVESFKANMVTTRTGNRYNLGDDIKAVFFPVNHPNDTNMVMLEIQDRRICFMADCENAEGIPKPVLQGCDILVYDGMYEDKYYDEHIGWGHSTWENGVRLAGLNNVGRLIISHHNPRNSDEKLRGLEAQAQQFFPATSFARAGDRFLV